MAKASLPSTPCAGAGPGPGVTTPASTPSSPPTWPCSGPCWPGETTIVGFRNHDLVTRLYARPATSDDERRRRCARVSRLIAKLRGHRLVAKVRGARLYRVTPYGQRVLGAALAVHDQQFPAAYLAA